MKRVVWALLLLAPVLSAHSAPSPLPPLLPPPGWMQHPIGFCREECVNFDFARWAPGPFLRIRLELTKKTNRSILNERCVFVLVYSTDPFEKKTAAWVRSELFRIDANP